MGRLGCLGVIFAVALIWGGGQGVYTGITNTSPAEMSCETYINTKSSKSWVKLTNCKLTLIDAAYVKSVTGRIEEFYVPVRPITEKDDDKAPDRKIHILLAVKDPEILKTAEEMVKITAPDKALEYLVKNADKMVVKKDVSGLVRYGIDLKDKERRKLQSLDDNLDKNFIIIDENKSPETLFSGVMLLGGLALAFGMFKSATSKT